jgi:hypothetical protein
MCWCTWKNRWSVTYQIKANKENINQFANSSSALRRLLIPRRHWRLDNMNILFPFSILTLIKNINSYFIYNSFAYVTFGKQLGRHMSCFIFQVRCTCREAKKFRHNTMHVSLLVQEIQSPRSLVCTIGRK